MNNNLKHINTSKPAQVFFQGYSTFSSSAKNNQGLYLLAPINSTGYDDSASHAHFGSKVWDLTANNDGSMSYYLLTSDPNATTVQYNNSTQSVAAWATRSFSYNLNGVVYTMYEKDDVINS